VEGKHEDKQLIIIMVNKSETLTFLW